MTSGCNEENSAPPPPPPFSSVDAASVGGGGESLKEKSILILSEKWVMGREVGNGGFKIWREEQFIVVSGIEGGGTKGCVTIFALGLSFNYSDLGRLTVTLSKSR